MLNYRQLAGSEDIIIFPDDSFSGGWEKLPAGVYSSYYIGEFFEEKQLTFSQATKLDSLINFKSGVVNDAVKDASDFFSDNSAQVYKDLRVCHKMGMLLYGPPGTGKTSCARLIMEELAEKHKAICLIMTGKTIGFVCIAIRNIRRIQDNPIVIFMDEFDASIETEETMVLSFLDGDYSFNKSIFVGATNYLDKIPDRVKNRKSRIKTLYEVRSLPLDVYKEYISDRVPKMEGKVVAEFAYKSEEASLTIDQLKNALTDYEISKMPIDEAIKGVKI